MCCILFTSLLTSIYLTFITVTSNSPSVNVVANGVAKDSDGNVTVELVCQARRQFKLGVKWKLGSTDVASNGKLVNNSDGLMEARIQLIVPADKCRRVNPSTRTVVCTFSPHACIASYPSRNGIREASSQISEVKIGTLRILTCNHYFSPRIYGGLSPREIDIIHEVPKDQLGKHS